MLNSNNIKTVEERMVRFYYEQKEYEEAFRKFLMGEEGNRRNKIRNKKKAMRGLI